MPSQTHIMALADPAGPVPLARFTADPGPPAWLRERLDGRATHTAPGRHGHPPAEVVQAPGLLLVGVRVTAVLGMDILTFQQAVAEAYGAVFDQLRAHAPSHPVRLWAFVPEIHGEMGPGLDRYMAFNAGRFAAYSGWYGGREAFPRSLPTASTVGIGGDDLTLYCLAAAEPGRPVENPRQIPAYRYSRRFGPLPPCFARATVVGAAVCGTPMALLGGTASISGEESMYPGDTAAQLEETMRNLASLVRAARGDEANGASALDHIRELRIYHPRERDEPLIRATVESRCRNLRRAELLRAELCRKELLVEIEGLAEAPTS